MKITEIRIFQKDNSDKKLKAFATLTFDNCFAVRDVKIIEGNKGLFIAMPSRRMKVQCVKCGHGNVVHSRYCNECGAALTGSGAPAEERARQSEHKDIAHPVTAEYREYIQQAVLEAYESEMHGKPGSRQSPESLARSGCLQ